MFGFGLGLLFYTHDKALEGRYQLGEEAQLAQRLGKPTISQNKTNNINDTTKNVQWKVNENECTSI